MSTKHWLLSHFFLGILLFLSLSQYLKLEAHASVSFLDVGQGDSILIETKEGKNILIDAGPDGKVVQELSQELDFFNAKIDLFILTHPDLDHYGGVMDILQKYPIKTIMLTGVASEAELYKTFLKEVKNRNIPLLFPSQSKDLQLSPELYLDFLYPFNGQHLEGQEVKNKNDTSISLILRDQAQTPLFLLTGDAEAKQEQELLLSGQDLRAHVFKLGHHGSKTSSTEGFLEAIQAEEFVVSAGKNNKFGHPHQEVLDRLKGKIVKSTAQEGTLKFMLK